MKFGLLEVVDLEVYDEDGKHVATLDTLKDSHIGYKGDKALITVEDALLNVDLLKFLSDNNEETNLSDYEKSLKSDDQVFEIGGHKGKKCKLIGKSFMRNTEDEKDYKYVVEAPNATIENKLFIEADNKNFGSRGFDVSFEISPYNDKGSYYKVRLLNN